MENDNEYFLNRNILYQKKIYMIIKNLDKNFIKYRSSPR